MLISLLNNWKLIVGVLLLTVIGLWSYKQGRDDVQAEWDASIVAVQKRANEKSAQLEEELAAQRKKNQTINAQLKKVINANADYANCHVSVDGLHTLRDAISVR